jgi:hypothetical protein
MFSALRKKNGFSCRDFAEILRDEFPAANAAGVSLAERPEESGVTYTSDARRYIRDKFKIPQKAERRKDNAHLTCWLPDAVKEVFKISKEKRGFAHDKDYIVFLIMNDMALIEKAARSVGAEQGGIEKDINKNITENGGIVNDC